MSRTFKQLNYEQRLEIKKFLDNKISVRTIAKNIGVHHSTVYREIEKGTLNGVYNPEYAEKQYQQIRSEKGRIPILEANSELAKYIADLIQKEHYSPEKISNLLKEDKRFEDVSTNTIYHAIDNGLIPNVTRETLRTTSSTIFNGGQVVIPKWVMEQLNLKDGDVLQLEISDNNEIVYKKQ